MNPTTAIDVKNPEETKELIALLKQIGEIDDKVEYYKKILRAINNAINSISDKIKLGGSVEVYKMLGVTITKKKVLDGYDIAKLEIEQLGLISEQEVKKQYFESWLERKKQHDIKFKAITEECNASFAGVLQTATELKDQIANLKNYMDKYKNENGDQQLKNEYYLFLKYEIDRYKLKKK